MIKLSSKDVVVSAAERELFLQRIRQDVERYLKEVLISTNVAEKATWQASTTGSGVRFSLEEAGAAIEPPHQVVLGDTVPVEQFYNKKSAVDFLGAVSEEEFMEQSVRAAKKVTPSLMRHFLEVRKVFNS